MIKTEVSIITVILSMLQTSLDELRVFKSGSVLPILGSICGFAYIIRIGDHFCLGITFAAVQGQLSEKHKFNFFFLFFPYSGASNLGKTYANFSGETLTFIISFGSPGMCHCTA